MDYPPKGKIDYPFPHSLSPSISPRKKEETTEKKKAKKAKRRKKIKKKKRQNFLRFFPVAPLFLFTNKEFKKEEKKEIFFSISLPFPTPKSKKRVKRRRKETKEKEKEEKKERGSILSISSPKKKRGGKKREMILFSPSE